MAYEYADRKSMYLLPSGSHTLKYIKSYRCDRNNGRKNSHCTFRGFKNDWQGMVTVKK